LGENRGDLGPGKDQGKTDGSFRPGDLHQVQLTAEDVLVEKEQRRECLALSRGAYVSAGGKMGDEGRDLGFSHLVGVSFAIEEYEALDPSDIGGFGAWAVMPSADLLPDSVEQARTSRRIFRLAGLAVGLSVRLRVYALARRD
jgi:hypothetical protein